MAGGAYIVRRNADGTEAARKIGGSLPTAGSGAVQSRSWANGGAAVCYDKTVADEITAGYMPAALTAGDGTRVQYDRDPVRYVQVAGIHPRSPQDHDALQRYPELALHLLSESVRARGMARVSTGYMAGTAIHASLGGNYPADAKASATYSPNT